MEYCIGIDAGGTKTIATAYSLDGEMLYESKAGFGNLTVDFEKGISNIQLAIDDVIKTLGDEHTFICLGCAGIETGDFKNQAQTKLKEKYGDMIYVTNDAMLALYSALRGKNGILIIAGTGSIGYLKVDDEVKRFGGWGHLINDDGSGYSIGIKAIRFIAYSFDTNKSDTVLKKMIFKHLNITELKQLIDFTYKATKADIAGLVPIVEKAAEHGDEQAISILSWAGERLAYLAIGLCHQYNIIIPKIAISGSVIKKTEIVKKSFLDILNSELEGYTIIDRDFNPTKGGYYIYQKSGK